MQEVELSKTVVVGVGNIIRSDDGLGVHALRRLQSDPRTPPSIVLVDGGTMGPELVSYVWEASRLLLLDSVDAGQCPGTLIRMNGDELRRLPGATSVHQLGVVDLIATLSLASQEPPEIVLLGVQPASTDWGTSLTSRVEESLGTVVENAIAQLMSWSEEDRPSSSSSCRSKIKIAD
jgi:hydrogenase maturation protease